MKLLVFGLPGAGKSTLVKASKMQKLRLDLGHNAFKSDLERQKFYDKLIRFTTGLVELKAEFIMDTYPEYFDVKAVADQKDVIVWFLLPRSVIEVSELVDRVGNRDGYDSEFYKLYRAKALEWFRSWNSTYVIWRSILGKNRCIRKDIYQNEAIITSNKGGATQ